MASRQGTITVPIVSAHTVVPCYRYRLHFHVLCHNRFIQFNFHFQSIDSITTTMHLEKAPHSFQRKKITFCGPQLPIFSIF